MSWNPDVIWENMIYNEKEISRFRTEKFGTMTLIPKDNDIEYELTPLRTEGWYTNKRHPEQIVRSDDILLDSKRRDFTINCIYRYGTELSDISLPDFKPEEIEIEKGLTTWALLLLDENVLIIQNDDFIKKIFSQWRLNKEALSAILWTAISIWTWLVSDNLSILIDPHHGTQDLLGQKIRTVGLAEDRFNEDALRIIRWIRFANILNQHKQNNFDFDKKTWLAMQSTAQLITHISWERIHDELVKVFKQHNPFGYVSLLHELKILPHLFPSVANTIHNDQPVRYHSFDTFTHTLLCLHALQIIFETKEIHHWNEYLAKLAMLYHDVWKPEQYEKMWEAIKANPDNPDRSSYEYHTESWAKLAKVDLQLLSFSKKEIDEIARYIKRHHRPGEILDGKKEKYEVRLRKLMSEGWYRETLNLLDITIADRLGQYNPLQKADIEWVQWLKKILNTLHEKEGRFTMKNLAINGEDIMQHLNLSPGPEVWEKLHTCFERVLHDIEKRNNKETLLTFVS